MSPIPSRSAPLLRRQVVTTAQDDGIGRDPGAIAGIVIGSIVGVLLLIWIIRSCTGDRLGSPPQQHVSSSSSGRPRSRSRSSYLVYPEDDDYHHHHHHHHHRRYHDGHVHRHRSSSTRHSHSAEPRYHSRRRSGSARPVMVETTAPAPVYVYDTRRGRSRREDY